MSTQTSGIDAKAFLGQWLGFLTGMYIADINATPDEKWTESFGGCTRNLGALTADALSLILWTTSKMKGETPAEGQPDCSTKEKALALIRSASDDFGAALAAASDETLLSPVQTPFGMEMPLFMVAQIAVNHLWYHDGQVNYVQCLYGDGQVHWTA